MGYVLYADVMVFWSFLINVLAMSISSLILNRKPKLLKLLLWSFITGIITTMLYILLRNNIFVRLLYACIYLIMTGIYFKAVSIIKLLSATMSVIISMFLIYGIINIFSGGEHLSLYQRIVYPSLGMLLIFILYMSIRRLSEHCHRLKISISGQTLSIIGYKDTGNNLIDMYSKKPVNIIDYRIMKQLLTSEEYSYIDMYHKTGYMDYEAMSKISDLKIYPIPYSTIDSELALIPVFLIDSMKVIEDKSLYKGIPVGISRSGLNSGYQMLINNKFEI